MFGHTSVVVYTNGLPSQNYRYFVKIFHLQLRVNAEDQITTKIIEELKSSLYQNKYTCTWNELPCFGDMDSL
jgi:hypothetical protein